MKKFLFWVVMAILAVFIGASLGQAAEPCISSGLSTSDRLICTGNCLFHGVEIITDGTNNASVVVYDGTTATGTKLFQGTVIGASLFGGATFENPIETFTGIYVDVSGTGASYITYFKGSTD